MGELGRRCCKQGAQGNVDKGKGTEVKAEEEPPPPPPLSGSDRKCGLRNVLGARHKGHIRYDCIYSITAIGKPRETEGRLGVARAWEEEGGVIAYWGWGFLLG